MTPEPQAPRRPARERAQREVYYAGKEELLMNIKKSLYSKPQQVATPKADDYMSSYGDK